MNSIGAIPIFVAVCLCGPMVGQQRAKTPPPPPAAARPPAPRPQQQTQRPNSQAQKNGPRANGKAAPGETIQAGTPVGLERLTKLTPDQRNRALASLPPARREKIEQQLADYQRMKPEERAKVLDRYNRMQALPPQKQRQVRASIQQFAALPQPRKALVGKQLKMMKGLSESDRRTLMNSEEFRNKFTASEQQMIEDIALVTPQDL